MPRGLGPLLLVAAFAVAGCAGGGDPPPEASKASKPSKASVERAVRGWVRSAQGHDVDDFCSRTFMLYDTASFLWKRLEFVDPQSPGAARSAPASRVERDCVSEFAFAGTFEGAMFSGTRIVRVRRIRVEHAVRDPGGIIRTAVAELTTRHHSQPPVTGRLHLVLYRGRWRVTLRNG